MKSGPFTPGTIVMTMAPIHQASAGGCSQMVAGTGQILEVMAPAERGMIKVRRPSDGRIKPFSARADVLVRAVPLDRPAKPGDAARCLTDISGPVPGQGFHGQLLRHGEFVVVKSVAGGMAGCTRMHGPDWNIVCGIDDLVPYKREGEQ